MTNTQWQHGGSQQPCPGGYQQVPQKKNWLPLGIGVAVVLLIVLVVLLLVLFTGGDGEESAPATSSSASESQPESSEEPSDSPSDEPTQPEPSEPIDDPLASDVPLKPFPEQVRDAQLYDPGDNGVAAFYKTKDSVLYGASIYPFSMNKEILVRDLANTQVIQGWTCGFEAAGELPRCIIEDPEDGRIAVSNGKDLQDLAAWGEEFRKLY